jgi:uncharacterized protein YdaU (DUF1376 family)
MRGIAYFPCYPDALLGGMAGLNDELAAAYVRLLCRMYATLGPLENDPKQLRLLLGKRPQDIRRIVSQLMSLGKLEFDADGRIHNERADYEIGLLEERIASRNGAAMKASLKASLSMPMSPPSAPKKRTKSSRARTGGSAIEPESYLYSEKKEPTSPMPRQAAPDARQAPAEPRPIAPVTADEIAPSEALLRSKLIAKAKPDPEPVSAPPDGDRSPLIAALNRRKAEREAAAQEAGKEGSGDAAPSVASDSDTTDALNGS